MRRQPKGRLELTWMGKDMTLIPFQDGTYDYAWVDPSDPRVTEVRSIKETGTVGDEAGAKDNLLIVGDCGDALRSIGQIPEYRERYEGQVKLVYIDPPFNTGQTFTHYSDQMEHSVWLTFMRDRIREIKPLLAPDASIWVHLDDAEVHRMRVLLDEEFGAENYQAEVVWQKADGPRNDAQGFSSDHDTILVYGNSPHPLLNRMSRTAEDDARFTNPDHDVNGPWFDADPTAPGAATHQGMVFGVQHPITGKMIYPARGRCWTFGIERMLEMMNGWSSYEVGQVTQDEIDAQQKVIGTAATARTDVGPLIVAEWGEESARAARDRYEAGNWPGIILRSGGTGGFGRKAYAPTQGQPPRTWWSNKDVGHNRAAKSEIKSLFPKVQAFSTPKPERLLERVIRIATNPGDLVLDCFAGSGTTAAVAHKLGRRWITMELLASTAETFIIPRLTKVVDGSDKGGVSVTTERVAVDGVELPDGVSPEDAKKFNSVLSKVAKVLGNDVDKAAIKALRAATKTRDEKTVTWSGGGGFTIARLGPSMYDVDDETGEIYLSEHAVNGAWSRATAGQLGFRVETRRKPFIGVRGRQRLAVIDGVSDENSVRAVAEALRDGETAVVVAKAALSETAGLLTELAPGSVLRIAPDGVLTGGALR